MVGCDFDTDDAADVGFAAVVMGLDVAGAGLVIVDSGLD